MSTRTLRVPCTDPDIAVHAEDYLLQNGVDVTGRDGRHVLVPAGWSPRFVWNIAEQMLEQSYGHDDELAQWASMAASARSDDDPGAIRNQPGYADRMSSPARMSQP